MSGSGAVIGIAQIHTLSRLKRVGWHLTHKVQVLRSTPTNLTPRSVSNAVVLSSARINIALAIFSERVVRGKYVRQAITSVSDA